MVLSGLQKRERLGMMVFGALVIFFTGFPHVWAIYQPYAMALTGWSQEQASMCFYVSMLAFVLGNILGGRIQDRYYPRVAMILGGGIFTGGILLSAFALQESPVFMYLTYGFLQGVGQGMLYATVIATAQKWFPQNTGFASGVVVTANGLCGFFLAPVSKALLGEYGMKPTLLVVGFAIGVSCILGGIFVHNPPEILTPAEDAGSGIQGGVHQYTAGEMVRTKKFYFLLSTLLLGLISYLILSPLSQTVQMERGITPAVAVSAVMLGAVCNAGTRLILPALADKIGRISCIKGVLLVEVLSTVLLIAAPSYLTTVAIILTYGCYGGLMGNFPSLTSSIFGIRHSGENYGYVMLGVVIATLGAPLISSTVTTKGYTMNAAFGCGAVCAALAFLSLLLLQKELGKDTI